MEEILDPKSKIIYLYDKADYKLLKKELDID